MDYSQKAAAKMPTLVRLSLWGIKSRRMASIFIWFSVVVGVVSALLGFAVLTLYFLLISAPAYWYARRWVDKNGTWPTVAPSQANSGIMWGVGALLVSIFLIKQFFIGYYHIPQNGMYPGLPANSKLLTNKRAYSNAEDVKRGDIIVYLSEKNEKSYVYIWRVIGLPNDTVEAVGESLTLNGQAIQRELIRETSSEKIFRESLGEVSYEVAFDKAPDKLPPDVSAVVPADTFFVMGDNRFNAADGRVYGPVPFSAIIGKKM